MASVLVNKKVLRDERLLALMEATGRGRAELVGVLSLFWLATREDNVAVITPSSIAAYMPLDTAAGEAMGAHMQRAGYLRAEADEQRYIIVDNVKAVAVAQRRRAIAQKAGLASAAKRATKTRKKVAPQKALVAKPASGEASVSVRAWNAYAAMYEERYKTKPVSNATVRGQMAAIVKRIGERAIDVMPFYVAHNDSFYVLKHHPVGLALKDCEALVTQHETHRPITSQDVRSAEKEYGYAKQLEDIRAGKFI